MRRPGKIKLNFLRRLVDFRNYPLMAQVFTVFGFLFLIMLLLSLITYLNYRNDKSATILNAIDTMNSQVLDKIDEQVSVMNSVSKLPYTYYDNNFNLFLDNLYKSRYSNGVQDLNYITQLNRFYTAANNYNKSIHSAFLININGVIQHAANTIEMYPDFNAYKVNGDWMEKTIQLNGQSLLISTYKLPYIANVKDNSKYVFSLSRAIMDVNTGKAVGVVLVNTRTDFLANLCKKVSFESGQRIAIIDKENKVAYDTSPGNLEKKFDIDISGMTPKSNIVDNALEIDGEKYLVSCRTSDATGWKIVNIISESQLNKSINKMGTTTVVITLLLVLIGIVFVILFARQIIIPIKKLVSLMKLIEKGDFDVKIKFRNKNELGQLARTFNKMVRKVKRLINEVYVDKLTQKELELQMLQNQINPHFLYNTLESIHMMAEINRDNETSRMARALGRILRYGISRKHETVTVSQELDHLNDYIMLQNIRFSNLFKVVININPSLYDYVIPKLILQPIIENSIYHGLENVLSDGVIEVIGYASEDAVVLKVVDNGKGMDQETVKRMNDYINDLDNSMNSIGLKNVNSRIKLHFGSNYGLTVTSILNLGTTVEITLPAIIRQYENGN